MLDLTRYYLLRIHRWAFRHPRSVLSLSFLVLAVSLATSSQLRFLLSIDDLIDPDFQTYSSLKKVNEAFHDHSTIYLSIESTQPFTKTFLCSLQSWIVKTADTRKDLARLTSSFGIPRVEVSPDSFRMPSRLDLDCSHRPVDETAKIKTAYQSLRSSPWRDILTADPYGLTILFSVRDPEDTKYGTTNTKIVGELEKDFEDSLLKSNSGVHAFWGGVTTYQSHLRHAFDQTLALNGLTFLVTWCLMRVFFGSWWIGTLFNLSAVVTSLIVYGLMGALHAPIDSLSNSVGLMVMIACLEDFVFIAYGCQRLGWSMRTSLRRFLIPSFFTSLTTAIGFGSLVVSDLGIVRRFGWIAASAALIEWLLVFFVIPAAIAIFPKSRLFHAPLPDRGWKIRVGHLKAMPHWAAWILIAVGFVCMLGLSRLKVKDSPADFFAKSHIVSQTTDHLLETHGWINEVSLLFNQEADLTSERKNQISDLIRKVPHVHAVESSGTVLKYLESGVREPSDRRLIERIWQHAPQSERLMSPETRSGGGLERAEIYIDTMDMDQVRDVIKDVKAICGQRDCELVGSLISYNEYSVRVLQTLFSSLGMSLLLVSLVIFLIGRKLGLKALLACILSSAWGSLILLGFFVVFEIPLFFVSCVCASVLVGLAGDNAIQFIMRSTKARTLKRSLSELGDASFIIMICMIGVTTPFFFSEMAPLRKLGVFMVLGFIFGFIGDVFILKGLQSPSNERDA